MEILHHFKTKRAKRLAKRKIKRQYVKWLIKNQYFYTWARVQRRREKPTKSVYWLYFLNCFFLEGIECSCDKEGTGKCHCPCILYTPKQR